MKKEYKFSRKYLAAMIAAFILMSASMFYGNRNEVSWSGFGLFLLASNLFPGVLGILMALFIMNKSITVDDEKITSRSFTGSTEIPLKRVKGYRHYTRDRNTLVIMPEDTTLKPVYISSTYTDFGELKEWVTKNFRDLDRKAKEQDRKSIAEDRHLGKDEKGRFDKLAKAKVAALVINTLSVFAGVVTIALIYKDLYPPLSPTLPLKIFVALVLALPVAVIVISRCTKGLIIPDYNRNSEHPGLAITLIVPVFALGFTYDTGFFKIVNYTNMIKPGAVVFCIMMLAGYKTIKTSSEAVYNNATMYKAAAVVYVLLYSFSFVLTVNWVYDRAKPQVLYPAVISKESVKTSDKTSNYVTVEKWGPFNEPVTLKVNYDSYDHNSRGDKFRIDLYSGLFNVPYYVY